VKRCVDVLVVGAGISGLAAALMLANTRHGGRLRVTLADAGEPPAPEENAPVDLRVSAIAAGSAVMLAGAGAWQHLEPGRCGAFDHMRVWDAGANPDGPTTLRFDAAEFGVPHLGWIVENRLIRHALARALSSRDVTLRFGTAIAAVDFSADSPVVTFAGGEAASCDLLVAADGGESQLRTAAGIDVDERNYGQAAFVAHFETARPHGHTAWQRFLPDGPLGLLPLADGRVSVVWSTTPGHAAELQALSADALGAALTAASDGILGEFRAGGPRGSFRLVARHARRYVGRGFALVGDAAHAVHPLAGQGANLGIADAATLAGVVEAALTRREWPGDRPVLRRYERARRGENAAMLRFVTGLNALFASDSALLGELRRTGMALFNLSGPIRATMAGVALGRAAGRPFP
jgi:2-octaprenylphenol hydroxylase